jgi:diguanylate cyclase (GGDEF)-like protein
MTERKKANEQLLNSKREMEFRANHDELTGLPNRSRLHDMTHAAIVTAQNRSQKLALMLIDLDRFKEVNDTLGHAIGDKLLQKIARQLDQILRARRAQLYRLGGDEFAVLMPNALDEPDILSLANAIHTSLRSPTEVEGISLELGGSVGISIYPRHGDNSHSLLRCADVAMYRAKSEASRTVIYNTDQDAHSPRRLSMMSELGTAIRQNQLVLHYQPRVHIASKRCMGCEALVRWQHPRLGMVPPAEFIPLAEMGDLIQPLGLWVLENALQQIVRWRERGLELLVSVNLSTRNLMDSAFPSHIEKLLKKYPVPPSLLEVEITESTLIGDPERALSVIGRIHNLGVRFAIDDFGTGYSSLGYLKRLPIDTLKIDRSFVRDMLTDEQDAVIVRSTLGLAHSFGLEVVAEGVEDVQTLEALKNLNCEQAQGYVISRPVPANEFEAWYRAEGNPPADS